MDRQKITHATKQSSVPSAGGLLQRKCDKCRKKKAILQRSATGSAPETVPSIVQEVLSSPGAPLDAATRSFMEPRFTYHFSNVPAYPRPTANVQTKLVVNPPGDVHEREADSVSEQVMTTAISSKPSLIRNFGHNFSRVRVHSGAKAEQSARALNARAYTVGHDIVFGAGMFAPETQTGRRLLAHELTHVEQQEGCLGAGIIQRAEVDDRSCAALKDIESDIDVKVNKEIDDERKAMTKPIFAPLLSLHVMQRLGGRSPISPIEVFIEGLPISKRNTPSDSLAGTKYSGVDVVNPFYGLQTGKSSLQTEIMAKGMGCKSLTGCAHVVGSVTKIHNICVGADKLGHFFDQGFDYLETASKPGAKPDDTENLGREMEMGVFGLGTTGVFSNADLAANRAGLKFYKDLQKNPEKFKFNIKNYVTNQWNEQTNPSFYESKVASVVWSNLLTGPWEGTLTSASSAKPIKIKFNLNATTSGDVTGTFKSTIAAIPKDVTIKNGKVTQKTVSISATSSGGSTSTATPVSGISIEFEWELETTSGKGKLESINEQTLNGTLGKDGSMTGIGTLKLKKV